MKALDELLAAIERDPRTGALTTWRFHDRLLEARETILVRLVRQVRWLDELPPELHLPLAAAIVEAMGDTAMLQGLTLEREELDADDMDRLRRFALIVAHEPLLARLREA